MKKKMLALVIILSILCTSIFQFTLADQFWDLYKAGDTKYNNGDIIGAIGCWEEITKIYQYDTSVDSLTRSAVYWTKIADAYNELTWYGEAQIAYKNVEYFWNQLGETDSAWGPNRTATRLKTELEIYAKVPADKNTKLAKFEPYSGMYFGASFDKDNKIGTGLQNVETVYGKKHAAFLMYVRWGESIQYWTANQAKELGAGIQIAWEPPADMNNIKQSEVESFAKELKKLDIPVFLRFASEMNELSNPWSINSPEVYKKVFKMVADVMHKDAPNVAMVWSPNYVPMDTINDFYPGDSAVDWVGINGYTDRYFIGDPSHRQLIQDLFYQGYYANPLDRFEYIYNNYSDRKPIMISETGVQNYSMNTKEDFGDWASNNLRRLYQYIPLKYPKIKAIYYFNVDSNLVPNLNLKQNYGLSVNNKVFETYKDIIKSSYYLSGIGTNYNYQYEQLSRTKFNKDEKISMSSYAKITDPYISKLEYWIDGKKVSSSNKIPFESSIEFSKFSGGKHILRVDVYNSKNILSARRTYIANIDDKDVAFEAKDIQYIPKHKVLDDISNHWAKAQIDELISLWSVDGYGDGTFKPENKITRAEFYKLLSTSLGMDLEVNSNEFADIPYGHWAKQLIDGGVQLGILDKNEYVNGFQADKPITRAELAMWAIRALNGGLDVANKDTKFDDNSSIPQKYRGYINYANVIGIIDGFPDNTFKANETATRAQAVSMVLRIVNYTRSK